MQVRTTAINGLRLVILVGAAVVCIVDPPPVTLGAILFAAGLLAGAALALKHRVASVIAAIVLVFGTDWLVSRFDDPANSISYWAATLLAGSGAVVSYQLGLLARRS